MNETVAAYRMNPAEDRIVLGDELTEGMWVLPEDQRLRTHDGSEDGQIRAQRFRRIICRRVGPDYSPSAPPQIMLIGEWIDGHQETWRGAVTNSWLVKKETPGEEVAES